MQTKNGSVIRIKSLYMQPTQELDPSQLKYMVPDFGFADTLFYEFKDTHNYQEQT